MSSQLLLFPTDSKLTPAERFEAFHEAHPEVYAELRALALRLRTAGVKRYGMKSLWEVLRWHRALEKTEERKLNNDYTAYYARLLMANEPELEGFFETREQGNGRSLIT